MLGPANESCDLLFFPLGAHSGLCKIHPTWAGTFVLAALCLVFPQKHFILLDSDCVPVTLFEVADLWKEAHLARVSGHPQPALMLGTLEKLEALPPLMKFPLLDRVSCWLQNTMQKSMQALLSSLALATHRWSLLRNLLPFLYAKEVIGAVLSRPSSRGLSRRIGNVLWTWLRMTVMKLTCRWRSAKLGCNLVLPSPPFVAIL